MAQNLLKDKAAGITLMYSRWLCTLSTANNKLPGKDEGGFGRLSKFNKISISYAQDYLFQNTGAFTITISSGMLSLGVWEASFIIMEKGQ